MVQFMFTRHVAEGAKVIVVALDTVPSHSCQLEATNITNHTMVFDPWGKITRMLLSDKISIMDD